MHVHCLSFCVRRWRALPVVLLAFMLDGCVSWWVPPPGIGRELAFSDLPGWQQERQAEAWPALLRSCEKLSQGRAGAAADWQELCLAARALGTPDDAQARAFFEEHFRARVVNGDGGRDGLVTGYYEPLLTGSFARTERFRYPLYRRPDNLLVVDMAALYPELKGKPVRGRIEGNRVVPYLSRAEIGRERAPLAGYELLWVDDPVEAYVLQVQGSGRVRLPDGSTVAIGYADQNGHPYRSLGTRLIELGAMTREEVTLPRIRDWLAAHPDDAQQLLNSNPSYVFFKLREAATDGPIGSLGVPLSARRSIAVDTSVIPLGVPVWLDTVLPDGQAFRQLVLAQDTGGAIKGAVRADVFFGQGEDAGRIAGEMKSPGRLTVLLPKSPSPVTSLSSR